jgi:hypothetical protein
MRSPLVIAAIAFTLVLAACAPTGGGTTDPDPDPTVTVPETPTATAVVISLTGLDIVDQNGEPLEATRFDDPEPVLFLLGELLGSTPEPTEYPEFGTTTYDWGDVLLGLNGEDYSWVRVDVAELGGLPVQTTDGIQVGSPRADVEALAPYDSGYDSDGDGASDSYGVEAVTNPEYESLSIPGEQGTDFVEVYMAGDSVEWIRSPSNDYSDV